ncbi:MAM domain-containing glycosylphosphatidylinositol anchor protein 2-like [Trichosurus vulpecula]|uniref:MAM domain-containing glycosylphosphatidylinositol anchor protein 2-like n=1 Tax=Trichosurus vulpecula TaxID=9337 RepID=UPI00186B0A04|nr:MAM domain-containing glycosylphosphatidylinositol anchor protein 2-like [Trichosurus vulpecula]
MVSFKLSNKTASPSIKLLVDDPIVVNPGEAITLVCVTTGGEPTPTLTWVRSIGNLPEKTVLNGGTLTIPAITSDDAGTYSCIANNNVGNPAKKSTNIIVRDLVVVLLSQRIYSTLDIVPNYSTEWFNQYATSPTEH